MLAFLLACSPAPVVPPAAAPLELPQGARLLLDTEAVADAFPLGERIIQRTPGGAIVVRSRDRILERTVLGPAPAAAIGPDDTKVLVEIGRAHV